MPPTPLNYQNTGGDDDGKSTTPRAADAVVALAPPPATDNPWGSMATAGPSVRNTTFRLPRHDTTAAVLDLYASGHGCEEFW